jgi:hypothetical protein
MRNYGSRKPIISWRSRVNLVLAAVLAAALLGTAAVFASGSGPAIDWWVMGGGGGATGNGSVSINNILGQPLAGVSSSGSLSMCVGYWCYEQQNFKVFMPLLQR